MSSWGGWLKRAQQQAAVLSFLKTPRTRLELIEVSEASQYLVSAVLVASHHHGLINVHEWRRVSGRLVAVWAWQPQPWLFKDAPKPAPKVAQVPWTERKQRAAAKAAAKVERADWARDLPAGGV